MITPLSIISAYLPDFAQRDGEACWEWSKALRRIPGRSAEVESSRGAIIGGGYRYHETDGFFTKRARLCALPYDMSLSAFGTGRWFFRRAELSLCQGTGAHQRLYREQMSLKCYERYVQLPLGNEALNPVTMGEG
jgi:hypothetical protein